MSIFDRLRTQPVEERFSLDDYAALMSSLNWPYNAGQLIQSYGNSQNAEPSTNDYAANAARMKSNGPVFTLMAIRLRLFSQVRWAYQQLRSGKPGDLFSAGQGGVPNLDVLNDDPYLNGWMIRHADLAGNFYGALIDGNVWPLRPDWVQAIGNGPLDDYDTEIVGYAFFPGGIGKTKLEDARTFLKSEVIHWAPEPDPEAKWRGMSWLTPVIREMAADGKMTVFKEKFLDNAATPNMVVKFDVATSFENFNKFKTAFREEYEGAHNAYKTLFLGGGADATVVGANLKEVDFTATQGKGETRLANAAGVHPVVAGFSEGMQGSSLNAGNFGQARRSTADILLHPLWVSAAGALGQVIKPPAASRLWYDAKNVPFLREDAKDDAEIRARDAGTIRQLVDAGYKPDTVVAAVQAGDWSLLTHTDLFSVQLQPPGSSVPANATGAEETP